MEKKRLAMFQRSGGHCGIVLGIFTAVFNSCVVKAVFSSSRTVFQFQFLMRREFRKRWVMKLLPLLQLKIYTSHHMSGRSRMFALRCAQRSAQRTSPRLTCLLCFARAAAAATQATSCVRRTVSRSLWGKNGAARRRQGR